MKRVHIFNGLRIWSVYSSKDPSLMFFSLLFVSIYLRNCKKESDFMDSSYLKPLQGWCWREILYSQLCLKSNVRGACEIGMVSNSLLIFLSFSLKWKVRHWGSEDGRPEGSPALLRPLAQTQNVWTPVWPGVGSIFQAIIQFHDKMVGHLRQACL